MLDIDFDLGYKELLDLELRIINNVAARVVNKIYGHVFFKDGGESEEEGQLVTARPRRVSELNMPNQTPPIPNASSFFIFSPTNR